MAQYKEYREVMVFYNGNGISLADNQKTLFQKDSAGIGERQIKISWCGNNDKCIKPKGLKNNAETFLVVLIGKDGLLKKQWTQPVTAEALFALIDQMPMRRDEMKRGKDGE